MIYKHIETNFPEPTREDREDARIYRTPEGKEYPSVSTVLGETSDDSYLEEWIARVGKEEADKISRTATARGTRIHSLCEDFLSNKKVTPSMFDLEMFQSLKGALFRIDNIRGIEKYVYSDILEVGGAIDLVADWDAELSIIDWKTSKRVKTAEEIHSYFKQTAAYALAWRERTGQKINKIVVVIAVDNEKTASVFIEKASDWIPEFIKDRKVFRSTRGF